MRGIRLVTGTAIIAVALAGCGVKEKLSEASIADDLADRGTRQLLEEAANDEYEGPADGRISEKQLEMYLKVRDHEKKIADVARKQLEAKTQGKQNEGKATLAGMVDAFSAMGSMADLATADIRAAKDLGFNSAEYQWVKSQILGAASWEMARKSQQALTSMMDSNYAQLKKQHAEADDATMKQMLGTMIQEFEKQRAEDSGSVMKEPDAAAHAYNYQLISKRSDAATVFAYEVSKWTGQATDEIQKEFAESDQQMEDAVREHQDQD